jgi:hypothetical protein
MMLAGLWVRLPAASAAASIVGHSGLEAAVDRHVLADEPLPVSGGASAGSARPCWTSQPRWTSQLDTTFRTPWRHSDARRHVGPAPFGLRAPARRQSWFPNADTTQAAMTAVPSSTPTDSSRKSERGEKAPRTYTAEIGVHTELPPRLRSWRDIDPWTENPRSSLEVTSFDTPPSRTRPKGICPGPNSAPSSPAPNPRSEIPSVLASSITPTPRRNRWCSEDGSSPIVSLRCGLRMIRSLRTPVSKVVLGEPMCAATGARAFTHTSARALAQGTPPASSARSINGVARNPVRRYLLNSGSSLRRVQFRRRHCGVCPRSKLRGGRPPNGKAQSLIRGVLFHAAEPRFSPSRGRTRSPRRSR